ncbi:MAG: hypothetical protein ACKVW3_10285 [Phycisphaerales bacterium]
MVRSALMVAYWLLAVFLAGGACLLSPMLIPGLLSHSYLTWVELETKPRTNVSIFARFDYGPSQRRPTVVSVIAGESKFRINPRTLECTRWVDGVSRGESLGVLSPALLATQLKNLPVGHEKVLLDALDRFLRDVARDGLAAMKTHPFKQIDWSTYGEGQPDLSAWQTEGTEPGLRISTRWITLPGMALASLSTLLIAWLVQRKAVRFLKARQTLTAQSAAPY